MSQYTYIQIHIHVLDAINEPDTALWVKEYGWMTILLDLTCTRTAKETQHVRRGQTPVSRRLAISKMERKREGERRRKLTAEREFTLKRMP